MEPTLELASRWKRLGGSLLDSLVAMAVTFPVLMVAGTFEHIQKGEAMPVGQRIFFFFFGLALFLVVNGYLLAKHGQTVGKRLVGTRIVSVADEQILPLGSIFLLRYMPLCVIAQVPLFGNLFCLVDVFFIFRPDKRCVHDLIAGTKVVNS